MANKIPLAIADLELQLATAISVGATSFTLSSSTDDDGNSLPNGLYCFTIDSGTSNKEYLIGQVNGTAVTSVKTVSRQGVETSGAARAHRVGAPCILTDFATIQRVADVLRGEVALDGANPIIYDAEPTLADRKELATVGYVLDAAFGGAVSFETQTTSATAGETIADGDLVRFDTSDQEWYKTDADTASTIENVVLGIALGSGTNGASISGGVLLNGIRTTTGLTAGALYYASNTAGAYSTSAGTTKKIIGLALSTTKLLFIPTNPQSLTTREKDALVGGGNLGTPSTANKFVTEEFISNQNYKGYASGVTTSATSTIAHGLGAAPSRIKITATATQGTSSKKGSSTSVGTYNGTNTNCVWVSHISADSSSSSEDQFSSAGTETTYVIYLFNAETSAYRRATVTIDDTNINLTWSTTGSNVGTAQVLWEAFS